jgi:hypothetical protein
MTKRCYISPVKMSENHNSHNLVVPDDFYGHVTALAGLILRSNHVGEDTLTRITGHQVARVQSFADSNTIVAFGVVPVVG